MRRRTIRSLPVPVHYIALHFQLRPILMSYCNIRYTFSHLHTYVALSCGHMWEIIILPLEVTDLSSFTLDTTCNNDNNVHAFQITFKARSADLTHMFFFCRLALLPDSIGRMLNNSKSWLMDAGFLWCHSATGLCPISKYQSIKSCHIFQTIRHYRWQGMAVSQIWTKFLNCWV